MTINPKSPAPQERRSVHPTGTSRVAPAAGRVRGTLLARPTRDTPQQTRTEILLRYPWVMQRDQKMVVGTDLDALMCAAFMHHHFGWQPIGVYNLQAIYAADGAADDDLKQAIWLDLDIARAEIKSIGHHILTQQNAEVIPAHAQSLNPNLLRGISAAQFKRKYPLATLHLLMWLSDQSVPGRPTDQFLFWLPDSCWITAQSQWLPNVREWLRNWIPQPFLLQTVEACRTRAYEERMNEFLTEFARRVPLKLGRGQTTSKWLKLTGYQCRFENPAEQWADVQATLDYIAQLIGWNSVPFPKHYRVIRGVRNHQYSPEFWKRNDLFSYAITHAGTINFTTFKNF